MKNGYIRNKSKKLARCRIITDTREQLPYWCELRHTLSVGDYTTEILHGIFHIERKSLVDLYGTLTSGNNRFKYELFKAAYLRIQLEVYVEGTYEQFINKEFPKGHERKFSTDGLARLIKTFERKYFLKFHWHKNRLDCRKKLEIRLKSEENSV
jgi:ERCC4-type nuclease